MRASHVGEMIRANALFVLAMASVLSCAQANLHRAARDNDAGFFTDDLSPEALNQREPGSGQTPLMAASLAGAHLAVDRLLSLGADHSLGEKDGYNPPHGVAFQGRPEAARALVKHGVPIDEAHRDGYTPLHRTIWGGRANHIVCAEVLVREGGADPDKVDGDGFPPSHRAAEKGWVEMLRALLEMGADANSKNAGGDTLLHVAVKTRRADVVSTVLEHGGDALAKNAKGMTAKGLAKVMPSEEVKALLAGSSARAGGTEPSAGEL